MTAMDARGILRQGLIDRNPGFVQLLGLCPLLAVSTSVASALGLGLATIAVLLASNAIAAVAGPHVPREVRLAVFVLVIAAAVTSVELAMAAWWPGLHAALGIFLPLIVTNCLVLARAESFASREPLPRALLDGLAMGLGFLLVLLALGASRELIGRGSLGANLDLLLGERFAGSGWQVFPEANGWLLALLPPGAFILLGLMLALINTRAAARRSAAAAASPAPAGVAS
jgi:electron transport complex protein RnfE